MRTKLVAIGNSKGIRIPSSVLKQCGIENEIDMIIQDQKVIIHPVKRKHVREGWEEAFGAMHRNGDDTPLLNEIKNSFDEDWQWK